jgi:Alr-MurF fusion protein
MPHSIETICSISGGEWQNINDKQALISHLVYDSRNIEFPAASLFFALTTNFADGHRFVNDAYKKGIRNFIVSSPAVTQQLEDCNVILVKNTLVALQAIAAWHRKLFSIPVIGITGSNGKTIVKEWLYQLLNTDLRIVRSPRSYNSQLGVPVSVWQLNESHELGIFEAGISKPNEMKALADVIQPTIGVLTNLGEAHSEGFHSSGEKLAEKLLLFENASVVIGPYHLLKDIKKQTLTWGVEKQATLRVVDKNIALTNTRLGCIYNGESFHLIVPFTDEASIENALTCTLVLIHLGYEPAVINERLERLHSVDMRLQLKHGINHCTIINDSYSADLTSLRLALNFASQQRTGQSRTAILSDIIESGRSNDELYRAVADSLKRSNISRVIMIGPNISEFLPLYLPGDFKTSSFNSTIDFLRSFQTSSFSNETILIKGARRFEFEKIVQVLEAKVHQTVLEIDLNAIVHNLKQYQGLLKPGTKMMAMVKAFSYGSGSSEIASILQHNHIDYLGVAYADEGIALRKAGITVPVMVMNADESSFGALIDYDLEPVLFSFSLMEQFENYLTAANIASHKVHIEIETGMNRLGFNPHEINMLVARLNIERKLKVVSVFTHLAASEDAAQDDFTKQQADIFLKVAKEIEEGLSYSFIKHMANSAAIMRHPGLQLDMVRLGIGLYGIDNGTELQLLPVENLRSTISQLKYLKAGETVSYNRRGFVKEDSVIATVRIGYADGYSRRFSNGVGRMLVNGQLAPVIGTVCMDMTMIDVSGIPGVKEGDEVLVFGNGLPVQQVAEWAGTIPYEIMTGISHRVKRVYFSE